MDQERKSAKGAFTGAHTGARICPQCGAAFVCGLAADDSRCWCFDFPAVMPVRADTACLCPVCLMKAIREVQEEQP